MWLKSHSMSFVKLFINLFLIASLIGVGVTGYYAFTHKLSPLIGAVTFIATIALLVWFSSLLRKPTLRYRKPSFTLVFWSVVGIILVCAFTGIQPLASYKDSTLNKVRSVITTRELPTGSIPNPSIPSATPARIPYGTYTATVAGWMLGISGNVTDALTLRQDGTYIRESNPGGKEMGTYDVSSNYISMLPAVGQRYGYKYHYVDQFKCLYLYLVGESTDPLPFYRQ